MKSSVLAVAAIAAGTSPQRLKHVRKPEKYPGQRRAYLIGANCAEGERMRKERGQH